MFTNAHTYLGGNDIRHMLTSYPNYDIVFIGVILEYHYAHKNFNNYTCIFTIRSWKQLQPN